MGRFPESSGLKAPLWLLEDSKYADVVLCTRVSQIRNIANMPFCTNLEDEARHDIHEIILKKFSPILPNRLNMSELDPLERYKLFERFTIPFRIAATPKRCSLFFNANESEILIVCGLEHIFLSFSTILENTDVIFKSANSAIELLQEDFKWAVHPQYGYLSSNPANCGAGVIFSIICHIPAIVLQNQVHQIRNIASENNMTIQDPWSGDFEGRSSYIKFVSRTLVGKNPMELLAETIKTAESVISLERETRTLLHERSAKIIEDKIMRAYGIASYARLIEYWEYQELISTLRLGAAMGFLPLSLRCLDELLIIGQQAHVGSVTEEPFTPLQVSIMRAQIVRERLGII